MPGQACSLYLGISAELANRSIHGVGGEGLQTPAAAIVEKIYIVAIVVIIGLMLVHWAIDIGKHLRSLTAQRSQIRRMTLHEVWQHTFVMITFIVLVISGFALRFSDGWMRTPMPCASAGRPSSTHSAPSRCGWARPTS